MTIDEVLYEHSYRNLVLYSAATPQYDDVEDEWDSRLDACEQTMDDEEEYIR